MATSSAARRAFPGHHWFRGATRSRKRPDPVQMRVGRAIETLEQRIVLHQPHDPMSLVAMSPAFADDGDLFVVTEDGQLLKSDDGGKTFYPPADAIVTRPVTSLTFSPSYAQDGIVFAGTQTAGLFQSSDRGETWVAMSSGIADLHITAFGASPTFAADDILFAGTSSGSVYRSIDGGGTWTLVNAFGNGPVTDIELSADFASSGTLLIAHQGQGVFRSVDAGDTFQALTAGLTSSNITALDVTSGPNNSQIVVAGTLDAGIFASFDSGASWVAVNNGLTGLSISDLEIADDGTIYAVSRSGGVFVRTFPAAGWTEMNDGIREFAQGGGENYFDLTVGPERGSGQKAFVATFGGLYETHDGGPQWVEANVYAYRYNREVEVSPAFATDQTFFAGTYGGGLNKTTDGGQTWTIINQGLPNVFIDSIALSPAYATDQTIFSGNFLGIYKSTDGGATWSVSQLVPGAGVEIYVREVQVSPNYAVDRTVYAGSSTNANPALNGLFRSTDGGATWTRMVNGLPANPRINQIAISPNFAVDSTLFVGLRQQGVYKSTDGGLTWTPAGSGFQTENVGYLRMSPTFASDRTLVAISKGRLWLSTNAGATWNEVEVGAPVVTAVALSPTFSSDHTIVVGAGPFGVFKSTNGGQTWMAGTTGLQFASINDIVFSPDFANDGTIFVGTTRGAYRSTDGGVTWTFIQTTNRFEDEVDLMTFSGNWQVAKRPQFSGPSIHYSDQAGATVEFEFYGSHIAWIGTKGPNHGRARILLDGVVVGIIDLYAPQLQAGVVIGQANVIPGWHRGTIEVLGTSRAAATGRFVTIDAFDVTQPASLPTIVQSGTAPVENTRQMAELLSQRAVLSVPPVMISFETLVSQAKRRRPFGRGGRG